LSEIKQNVEIAQTSFPEGEPTAVAPCPQTQPPKKTGKTWVEVALIDMLGKPVAGARYHVLLPNEAQPRIGKLDANGRVNFREIDPGICQITFPDYDTGAWGKPSGRWPVQRAPFAYETAKKLPEQTPEAGAETQPAEAPKSSVAEQKQKTWVEFALIDAAGKPVANARYRAVIPGEAAPRTGILDAQGRVTFHKIDPGTCTISFPDYDREAWHNVKSTA
jgi:hypothetical protein